MTLTCSGPVKRYLGGKWSQVFKAYVHDAQGFEIFYLVFLRAVLLNVFSPIVLIYIFPFHVLLKLVKTKPFMLSSAREFQANREERP